jgi:hypothetical protein
MDEVLHLNMSNSDKKTFNNWRMYFQVCSLSQMTNHSGKNLNTWLYKRTEVINFVPNFNINWPIQQRPAMTTFRI